MRYQNITNDHRINSAIEATANLAWKGIKKTAEGVLFLCILSGAESNIGIVWRILGTVVGVGFFASLL